MHAVPACALASLSLIEVIPEWVPTLYSTSYMVIDGVAMAYRLSIGDAYDGMGWMFVAHHFGCLPMCKHPPLGDRKASLGFSVSKLVLSRWPRRAFRTRPVGLRGRVGKGGSAARRKTTLPERRTYPLVATRATSPSVDTAGSTRPWTPRAASR